MYSGYFEIAFHLRELTLTLRLSHIDSTSSWELTLLNSRSDAIQAMFRRTEFSTADYDDFPLRYSNCPPGLSHDSRKCAWFRSRYRSFLSQENSLLHHR